MSFYQDTKALEQDQTPHPTNKSIWKKKKRLNNLSLQPRTKQLSVIIYLNLEKYTRKKYLIKTPYKNLIKQPEFSGSWKTCGISLSNSVT